MTLATAPMQPSFADVDAAGNAARFVDYLDNVRKAQGIKLIDDTIANLVASRRPELIVEIGCGTGDLLKTLVAASPRTAGIGIEKSDEFAQEARRRHWADDRVGFVTHDLMTAPPDEALFAAGCRLGAADVVLLNRVVQHLGDPVRLLANARPLLRPGGIAVLSDVDWTQLSVSHPDRETTALVLAEHIQSIAFPNAGSELGRLLVEAGYGQPEQRLGVVHEVVGFAMADGLFRLSEAANRLIDKGIVGRPVADRWLRDCRSLDADGAFIARIPQSVVFARTN